MQIAKRKMGWLTGALLLWLAAVPLAQAFYNPSTGRWLSRDPIGDETFLQKQVTSSERKSPTDYTFVRNETISRIDYLGLLVVCCRGGDPEPDDPALVRGILPLLRHCEIQETSCPDSKWSSYPITVSKTGKMDNSKCCSSVTTADITACLKRQPYSAGEGRPDSNCQTSVIKSLANCCLKSTWNPNWYAGDTRGECLEWKKIWVRDGEGGMKEKTVCVRFAPFPIYQPCSGPSQK